MKSHPSKFKFEEVCSFFEERNWEVLSSEVEYKNAESKLRVLCDNRHETTKTLHSFKKGTGCLICKKLVKYSYEEFVEHIEKRGWKMISEKKDYKNVNSSMNLICNNSHKNKKSFSSFVNKNTGCMNCKGKITHTYEEVKKMFEEEGWRLLTTEYKGSEQKLRCVCPNGHFTIKRVHCFKKGRRCYKCSDKKKYTYEEVKNIFENKKWILLSEEYNNASEDLNVICPYGHNITKKLAEFNSGRGCPECNFYKNEEECRKILQDYFFMNFEKVNPDWLNGLELDGYNEELNLAFEYHGQQHYSYYPDFFHKKGIHEFVSQICRDKIKRYLCKQKGIDLIEIPYHIKNKKRFILEKIKNIEK